MSYLHFYQEFHFGTVFFMQQNSASNPDTTVHTVTIQVMAAASGDRAFTEAALRENLTATEVGMSQNRKHDQLLPDLS